MTPSIELNLPLPTSANKLWQPNGWAGFRKTSAYKRWLRDAGWLAKAQHPKRISGPYKLTLHAVRPDHRRRDLGNLLKATEDLMVSLGLIDDDSYSEMIVMRWVTSGEGIHVRIEPAGIE